MGKVLETHFLLENGKVYWQLCANIILGEESSVIFNCTPGFILRIKTDV